MALHELTEQEYLIMMWCLLALATLFTVTRLTVRWLSQRRFHDDDWWAMGSWVSLIILVALYSSNSASLFFLSLYQKSYNEGNIPDVPLEVILHHYKIFAVVQLVAMFFFWGSLWGAKMSLLFFFKRLMQGVKKYMPYWYLVTAITVLTFWGCFLSNWLTCLPLERRWSADPTTNCSTPTAIASIIIAIKFASGVDAASDICIMLLPLPLLYGLRVSLAQKMGLALIFCLGAIVILFCFIRLASVTKSIAEISHTSAIDLAMWSAIECVVAVVVISLPSLRGLLSGKLITKTHGTPKGSSAYGTGMSNLKSGRSTNNTGLGTQVNAKGGTGVHIRLHDVDPKRVRDDDVGSSSSQEELRKGQRESEHGGINMTREVFVSSHHDEENQTGPARGPQGVNTRY